MRIQSYRTISIKKYLIYIIKIKVFTHEDKSHMRLVSLITFNKLQYEVKKKR